MSFFTWSLFTISFALLVIQMAIVKCSFTFEHENLSIFLLCLLYQRFQLHHGNVLPLLASTTLNGISGFCLVFVACELGQRIADAFDGIDLTIQQFDWYSFPIEMKQMLPIIILNAQQPVSVACFGSIICTRDVFKNVGIDY